MDMTPVAAEVDRRMKVLGLNAKQLSRSAGLNETYVRDLLEGKSRNPRQEQLSKLAKALGCTINDLTRASPDSPPRPVRSTDPVPAGASVPTVRIPQVDIEAAAGPGAIVPEILGQDGHAVVATWDIAAEFARSVASRPEALVVVQVRGRSMEPIFRHGDYVFVDTEQRQIHGGDAYVFWDGAALVVKQLEVMAGTTPLRVRILSRNPDFPPYEAPAADLHVSGRVVGRLGRW